MEKYSVVVLGGGGVGKSAITLSFTRNQFVEEYDPTIEDCYVKNTVVDGSEVQLDITDTAGQEEYRGLFGDKFMRQGDGFICVYSVTHRQSLVEMAEIRSQIHRAKDSTNCPIIVCGNKCDLAHLRQVSTDEGLAFARESSSLFMETSAKERINIEEAFHSLVRIMRERAARSAAAGGAKNASDYGGSAPAPSSGCCIIL
ncbi:MAG: ras-like protein rasS [Piptocephalis tieghemiana]|nr:MAG: ras-like protein rasS [Piptocephalis tieghemiana]